MISQHQIAIGMPLINADNTDLPVRQRYEVDTSGAARAVTLPPSTRLSQGDWVEFIEPVARNQLATNNLTINAGAGTTIRGTTPLTVNVNNIGVLLFYRGTNWEAFYFQSGGAVTQATETASGGGEIATRAETLAGTLDTHLITPTKVRDFVGRQANYSNINNGVTIDNHIGLAVLDASGAAFALNLPTISAAIPAPWRIRVVKTDASANDVTINRGGTDTFNDGSTSKTISGQHTFAEFIRRDAGNVWHYQAYSAGAGTPATQAQAIAGSDNTAVMTPLRTREVLGGVTGYTFANNNNTIVATTGFGFVDATGGAMTLNLPLTTAVPGNHRIRIVKSDASANAVTISRSGTDVFNDGATTKVLSGQHAYAEFINRSGNTWHYQAPSAGGTLATQAQALAGTDNVAFMSALRTREVLGNVVQYSSANNGNTIAVTVGFARIDGSVAFTLNLPDGANIPDNHRIRFVKMDATANALTVSRSGTNTFNDGATTKTLVGQHSYAEAIYRGAGVWHWQAAASGGTVATQAQALAGTENTATMTALRTREVLGTVQGFTNANNGNTIAITVGFASLDASGAAFALNLPQTTAVPLNHRIRFVKTDNTANVITINRSGTDTFHDTSTSFALSTRYAYVEVVNRGGNVWQLKTFGSVTRRYTASGAIGSEVGMVIADTTAGTLTLTLPDHNNLAHGHRIGIIKVGAAQHLNVNITGTGFPSFSSGLNSLRFHQNNSYAEIVYRDGNTWQIIHDGRRWNASLNRTAVQSIPNNAATRVDADNVVTGFAGSAASLHDSGGRAQVPYAGYYDVTFYARFAQSANPGVFTITNDTGTILESKYMPGATGRVAFNVTDNRRYAAGTFFSFSVTQTTGAALDLTDCLMTMTRMPKQAGGF